MGQPKHSKNRNRGSASGYFLSPSRGASSVPMNAKVTPDNKAGRGSTLLSALPYAVGVFGLAFLASCVTASIMTPVQNSDATTQVNIQSNAVAYYVNIASGSGTGVISKDIQATFAGTRGIVEDELVVKSNTPSGYHVYVSMANATNGQKLVNTTDSSYFLNPISGNGLVDATAATSLSNPAALTTANTWGVAVASSRNSLFSSASEYTDGTVTNTTRFAPVPAYGAEELLFTRTGDTTVDGAESDISLATQDTIAVYYGYYATSGLPSGTYSNTVLYTAYAEAASSPTAAASGSVADYTDDTTRISFTTSLYTDRTITADQVSVTIGNRSCTNIVVSKAGAAGTNDSVVVTCTAPAQPGPGDYTATITIDDYGHTSHATVAYGNTGDAPRLLVAVTKNGTTVNYAINTMQDFAGDNFASSSDICEAWDDVEAASNYDSTNNAPYATTGNAARTYSYGNGITEAQIKASVNYDIYPDSEGTAGYYDDGLTGAQRNWNTTVAGAAQMTNINTDVPEVSLKDERDGTYYRIRKLADNNCWMTENLRLVFAADGTNSVGKIENNAIVAQDPAVTINEDNSNVGKNANGGTSASKFVTGTGTGSFAEKLAYTETSANNTKWGATDGDSTAHPTGGAVSTSSTDYTSGASSNRANTYSRSYYRSGTISTLDGDTQKYGVYYNWKAATAGTSGNYTTRGANATDSICPAGWRLPTNSNYNTLIVTTYGGADLNTGNRQVGTIAVANATYKDYHTYAMTDALQRAPLSFPFSGYYGYYSGGLGGGGRWWSSTAYSATDAYNLVFLASYLDPQDTHHQGYGFAVRCVAQ